MASQGTAAADGSMPSVEGRELEALIGAACGVLDIGEGAASSDRQVDVNHKQLSEFVACGTDGFELPTPAHFSHTDGAWLAEAPAAQSSASAASKASTSDTVDFPDAALRAAVAAGLGKESDDAITMAEMERLTTLSAANRGIADLTGLRHAANLQRLYLDSNEIADVWELAGLSR